MSEKEMHKGHRERMKQRFLKDGLDNFAGHEVLELLLFYAIPQQDTNPLAHRLIETFGGLTQVLDADIEDLKKVPGIGSHSALLLSLVTELCRYYQVNTVRQNEVLDSLDACGAYLVPHFFGRSKETVFLLCLDAKCKYLCCKNVGEGSVNSANVSIRKIVQTALTANATTVVLAHNHPSGMAVPSQEDVETTRRVYAALKAVDVNLADHFVVADGEYISMVQSGCCFDEGGSFYG